MELEISIIGFGNIGKTIATLLLPFKEINFNINIIDNDASTIGAILDLKHGAQLHNNHQISYNSNDLLNKSDFIFHCAGASVPIGKSRLVTCQESIEITEKIFNNFSPIKEPFIIVVTNPVEIISLITQKITGLPKKNIIGTGTLLDSIRMNYIIKQTKPNLNSIQTIILGEHGKTAFLSQQLSTVNELPFNSLFNNDTIDTFIMKTKGSAQKIKETQKATIYGVSYCAIKIFQSLISQKPQKLPVSTFIPEYLKLILGDNDIYLSLYSEISQKGSCPIENYHPNITEQENLKKSIHLIKQNIPNKYL